MRKDTGLLSDLAIFAAGVLVAGGIIVGRRKGQTAAGSPPENTAATGAWRDVVSALETRIGVRDAATAARLARLETRLEEHSAKLAEMPSTEQIVGAMEQLLARTMTTLDQRLTTQAHSIDILKTTVSQTDTTLERVLKSLDSLQACSESSVEDPLLPPMR